MLAAFRLPALAALLFVTLATPSRAADSVSIQLDWVPRGAHAMFFVARDKGYSAANGIEIAAIRPGTGSVASLRQVGAAPGEPGAAEFGFGRPPHPRRLARARRQGGRPRRSTSAARWR